VREGHGIDVEKHGQVAQAKDPSQRLVQLRDRSSRVDDPKTRGSEVRHSIEVARLFAQDEIVLPC